MTRPLRPNAGIAETFIDAQRSMTRARRLLIGSGIIVAIGCAAAQRAERDVPPGERVKLEAVAIREACMLCDATCGEDVLALCKAFLPEPDDAPHSGDSGPAISQGSAAGLGNGVRSIGGASGR